MILGIVSLVCCSLCGPVALFMSLGARKRIAASGGTIGGGGMATAGLILGILGTIVLVLGIIYVIFAVILGVVNSTHSSGG